MSQKIPLKGIGWVRLVVFCWTYCVNVIVVSPSLSVICFMWQLSVWLGGGSDLWGGEGGGGGWHNTLHEDRVGHGLLCGTLLVKLSPHQ